MKKKYVTPYIYFFSLIIFGLLLIQFWLMWYVAWRDEEIWVFKTWWNADVSQHMILIPLLLITAYAFWNAWNYWPYRKEGK